MIVWFNVSWATLTIIACLSWEADRVHKKMDALDARLSQIEFRLNRIDERLGSKP